MWLRFVNRTTREVQEEDIVDLHMIRIDIVLLLLQEQDNHIPLIVSAPRRNHFLKKT